MENQLPEKVRKALNGLLFNHAFYASMVLKREVVMSDFNQTAFTNGKVIGINPEFVEKEDHEGLLFTFAHESEHIARFHHIRGAEICRTEEDWETWNEACDLAINPLLFQSGFHSPKSIKVLNDARFPIGTCAENIYRALKKEKEDGKNKQNQKNQNCAKNNSGQPQNSNQPGKPQNGQPNPNGKPNNKPGQNPNNKSFGQVMPVSSKNIKEEYEKTELETKQSMQIAKSRGQLPGHLQRIFDEVPPRNDVREILARFISERTNNDFTMAKPNRRYLNSGFFLPSMFSKTFGKIILAIDTSGSISQTEVSTCIGMLQDILAAYAQDGQAPELLLIWCDSVVQSVQEISDGDKPIPKGGGGTDFDPPFKWIAEHGETPVGLIYLTDGYGPVTIPAPDYPVLWGLLMHNPGFKPHFGETLYIGNMANG